MTDDYMQRTHAAFARMISAAERANDNASPPEYDGPDEEAVEREIDDILSDPETLTEALQGDGVGVTLCEHILEAVIEIVHTRSVSSYTQDKVYDTLYKLATDRAEVRDDRD